MGVNSMKKFAFLAVFTAFVLSSCAHAMAPVTGFIYSDVKGPFAATSNTRVKGGKVGTATATSILGWVAQGDASIEAAAKSAGITKITNVDYYSTNILGIYATFTVTVYGE